LAAREDAARLANRSCFTYAPAHYWTRIHPELTYEDDVEELLATHSELADRVLNDPEASACDTTTVILDELHSLRRELTHREEMERSRIERARAEARTVEVVDADRRKTEFLAILAHELRNPLAPILNAVQILRITGSGSEAFASASEMLERQVAQMVRLIDDLLDLSRINRGQFELRREPVELSSVVSRAVESVRPLLVKMGHELTVTLPPDPVYLNADPARLAQIVGNLLNNACKFTERGGRIGLECQRWDAAVEIRIKDNGVGIAAEQLPGVFELFAQIDRSRSQGGLGVGLNLVKNLVEMHGGTVDVRSGGAGLGCEFTVRLAVVPMPPPPLPAQPTGRRTTPRRILVVDDNRDAAESLAALLELHGHEVQTAHDGLEAVEAAARLQPEGPSRHRSAEAGRPRGRSPDPRTAGEARHASGGRDRMGTGRGPPLVQGIRVQRASRQACDARRPHEAAGGGGCPGEGVLIGPAVTPAVRLAWLSRRMLPEVLTSAFPQSPGQSETKSGSRRAQLTAV
jgi:signal transduction histidine kinase